MFKILLTFVIGCSAVADEAVVLIGERIFNDVRFSKHFVQNSTDVNSPVDLIPEQSKLISCASCHMVDQEFDNLGMRVYNDFEVKTPLKIPAQGMSETLRNTPGLVGIGSKFNRHTITHWDGEVLNLETYLGNFTGPHMGWEKDEKEKAYKNVVKVFREDQGNMLEGMPSYKILFNGTARSIPEELRLEKKWRKDISTLTDQELVDYISAIGDQYLMSLDYATDDKGNYNGSPYDQFLIKNNIETNPKENESNIEYTNRLIKKLRDLVSPKFVEKKYFPTHKKSFGFGQKEWRGLKVFFNLEPNHHAGRGMCIQCHHAPLFTDQSFHNVGITQKNYDLKNGDGSFMKLNIPNLKERDANDIFMLKGKDLGVWNFFGRKKPVTDFIRTQFCRDINNCSNEELLPFMTARFKTPTLRNLNMSEPYFHTGEARTLKETMVHYKDFAMKVRHGEVRNPALQMRHMHLNDQNIDDVIAFMNSLNEDYE